MPPGLPEVKGSGAVGLMAASIWSVQPPMRAQAWRGDILAVQAPPKPPQAPQRSPAEQGTGEPGIKQEIKCRGSEYNFFYERRPD